MPSLAELAETVATLVDQRNVDERLDQRRASLARAKQRSEDLAIAAQNLFSLAPLVTVSAAGTEELPEVRGIVESLRNLVDIRDPNANVSHLDADLHERLKSVISAWKIWMRGWEKAVTRELDSARTHQKLLAALEQVGAAELCQRSASMLESVLVQIPKPAANCSHKTACYPPQLAESHLSTLSEVRQTVRHAMQNAAGSDEVLTFLEKMREAEQGTEATTLDDLSDDVWQWLSQLSPEGRKCFVLSLKQ